MKVVFRYLFNTGHGVLVCQLMTSVMSLLGMCECIPKRMGGICFIAWLASLVLVAVMVPVSLFRRRWDWAAMQLFGGLLLFILVVAIMVRLSFVNMEHFSVEDQPWQRSKISKAIPFSVESRLSNPWFGEYDRRLVFKSGKRVDLWGDGTFAVYVLDTGEFYLVENVSSTRSRSEYRVDVANETVFSRSGESVWRLVSQPVQVKTGLFSYSFDDFDRKTDTRELGARRFVGRITHDGDVKLGGTEPVFKDE